MAERWYNSPLGQGLAIALILGGCGFGGGTLLRGCGECIAALDGTRQEYKLQEADLNGNGIPEKFYTIGGKIAVVEIDGKPITQCLDLKVLRK